MNEHQVSVELPNGGRYLVAVQNISAFVGLLEALAQWQHKPAATLTLDDTDACYQEFTAAQL